MPWRAMRLHYHLLRAEDEALPHARADAAILAETLFDDLETLARGLERDADDDPDTEDAPARLEHFAEFAGGVAVEATTASRSRGSKPAATSRRRRSRDSPRRRWRASGAIIRCGTPAGRRG